MSQTSAQSPPPPTLQAHTTNPRARKPSRPAHAAVSSPIPSFALAIQSVHRDSISSNIPNSRRSTPKKCLNGTISRLRYKKARGMCSANAQRTQEMPPSCYRRGCQGADGGADLREYATGQSGCCVRKKSLDGCCKSAESGGEHRFRKKPA